MSPALCLTYLIVLLLIMVCLDVTSWILVYPVVIRNNNNNNKGVYLYPWSLYPYPHPYLRVRVDSGKSAGTGIPTDCYQLYPVNALTTVACCDVNLRITDRSFRYASPCLWNQLPIVLSVNLISTPLSLSFLFMLLPLLLTLWTHHSHHP